MTFYIESLADALQMDVSTVWKLFSTILVLLVLYIARSVVIRIVARRTEDVRIRYSWRKGATYGAFVCAILLLGRFWFSGFDSFTTYLGLLSAGVAIALKDPLANLAGWLFILWRRPFTVGDRIEIAGSRGDVIDVRIFQFALMEIGNWVDADHSTGRVIRIPNSKVFTETLANYSNGFAYIWNEIPVLLTFESDWQSAKVILQSIATAHTEHLSKAATRQVRQASEQFMIFYNKLTPIVYTSVRDSGVLLTIRYLCEPRQRRGTEEQIWEDILTQFSHHDDVDFAYPTQRLYTLAGEGVQTAPAVPVRAPSAHV